MVRHDAQRRGLVHAPIPTSDFDASVAGLHLLKERLDVGLAPDASGVKAVEAMEVMAGDPPRPPAGAEGADVLVTSVDEALGRPSGLTVLSGLDDERGPCVLLICRGATAPAA